jgi:hypothetical protein
MDAASNTKFRRSKRSNAVNQQVAAGDHLQAIWCISVLHYAGSCLGKSHLRRGIWQTVNLLALRHQWFESTPAHARAVSGPPSTVFGFPFFAEWTGQQDRKRSTVDRQLETARQRRAITFPRRQTQR